MALKFIFLIVIGGLLSFIGLLFVMWLSKSRRDKRALLVAGTMIGVVALLVGVRLILGIAAEIARDQH